MKTLPKYLIVVLCAIMSFSSLQAQHENDGDKPNIIKFSPFHFAESTFLMSYERMISQNKAGLYFNAGIHSAERYDYYSGEPNQSFGFQGEFQYRVYISQPKSISAGDKGFFYFKGIYGGPYASFRYRSQDAYYYDWVSGTSTTVPEEVTEYAGGIVMGIQFALYNRVFFDFYTGGGIKRSFGAQSTGYRDITSVGYNGVLPKIGFQIGFGF